MRVDDLKIGQWVTIIESYEVAYNHFEECIIFNDMVTGAPLKVIAISLPFVVVSDGKYRFPIDSRECTFGRISPQYVKSLRGVKRKRGHLVVEEKQRGSKITRDAKACPNCGERMIERLIRYGAWKLLCKDCGFEGGLPPQET